MPPRDFVRVGATAVSYNAGARMVAAPLLRQPVRRPTLSQHRNQRKRRPLLDRFMEKVELPSGLDGCWMWKGATYGREGTKYGTIFTGERNDLGHPLSRGAHRVSYELAVGVIPDGMEIDHLCRVTLCVNPDHLEPVTRLENQRRGFSPMQAQRKQTHCKRNHPLDEQNTYIWHGMRRCRICQAADARRYRAAKAAR